MSNETGDVPARNFSRIVEAARQHYGQVLADIENAKDRIEHIRLTTLAQQARNLLVDLEGFELGLVYSHEQPSEETINNLLSERQDPLPEKNLDFKSPYNPDA